MHRLAYWNWIVFAFLGVVLSSAGEGQSPQQPTFRSSIESLLVDVQVVSKDGHPVTDLRASEFAVEFGGRPRRVSSLQLLTFTTQASDSVQAPAVIGPSSGKSPSRRQYIIAVDETSFLPVAALAWKEAIKRFVAGLSPEDLVGLYGYPSGGPVVPLTNDRSVLIGGIDRIVGRLEIPRRRYNMSISEAIDITAGDADVAARVAERECSRMEQLRCASTEIPREAQAFAADMELMLAQSIGGLRTLLRALKNLPERKTLVVVSGGLLAGDRIGGRIDMNSTIWEAGREAAEANLNLYVLHLDTSFLEMFSPRNKALMSQLRDVELRAQGLARFAGAGGGELIRVQAGTGDGAFHRVIRETSSYYLLSVDIEERDRKDRAQPISVRTSRRNVIVRHRAWAVVPNVR